MKAAARVLHGFKTFFESFRLVWRFRLQGPGFRLV